MRGSRGVGSESTDLLYELQLVAALLFGVVIE